MYVCVYTFNPHNNHWDMYNYFLSFTGTETEVQRDWLTCPRSQSWLSAWARIPTGIFSVKGPCFQQFSYTPPLSFPREDIAQSAILPETLSSKLKPASPRITQAFTGHIYAETLMIITDWNLIQVQIFKLFKSFLSLLIWLSAAMVSVATSASFPLLLHHSSSGPSFLFPHQPPIWALLALTHFTQLPYLSFQAASPVCHPFLKNIQWFLIA